VRWLIRIDAHCRYPDGYARGLVETAERTAAASVVVPMITQGQACFQKACAAAQNSVLGAGGAAHRKVGAAQFVDHGHHALFDLAAYAGVGGYDESFSHNEDAELDLRLARAGARVWLEPSLAIVYFPRSAPGPLFRQYFNYGKGRARTIQRHRTRLKARQAAPLAIAPVVLAAIAGLWFWPFALPAAAWAAACLAYGVMLSGKTRSVCVLLSGPAAMIMHFAWSLGFWRQALLGPRPGPEPQALQHGVGERAVDR
jgi:succinoglycan biosynthesis protein ExoA